MTERRLVLAAMLAWMTVAALGLSFDHPLGHDEAAFAALARGDEGAAAWLYRSEGTVALARLGVWLGGAPWQLRLASAAIGGLLVLAVFAVGKAAGSARGGAWAAALIAGAHPMVMRSSELLGDLPAAAAILLGLAILVGELARPAGPRWRLLAAAPCFAAAFYLRYGSAPVIAFAGALAVVLWWRTARTHPLRLAALAATLGLLLIPHLAHSLAVTGSALGILEHSAGVPRRAYVGEGLVTYLTSNPFLYYGFVLTPVMGVGLLRLPLLRRRASAYLGLVAVAQLVVLGLQSHGQPRYVYVAVALLTVLGAEGLTRHRLRHSRSSSIALPLVVLGWLSAGAITVLTFQRLEHARAPIVEAAAAIRAEADGQPCAAIAAAVPQLMWYSGCTGWRAIRLDPATLPPGRHYVISLAHRPVEVEPMVRPGGTPTRLSTRDPRVQVWRLP